MTEDRNLKFVLPICFVMNINFREKFQLISGSGNAFQNCF